MTRDPVTVALEGTDHDSRQRLARVLTVGSRQVSTSGGAVDVELVRRVVAALLGPSPAFRTRKQIGRSEPAWLSVRQVTEEPGAPSSQTVRSWARSALAGGGEGTRVRRTAGGAWELREDHVRARIAGLEQQRQEQTA